MLVAKRQEFGYDVEYNNELSKTTRKALRTKNRNRIRPVLILLCVFALTTLYVSRQVQIRIERYDLYLMNQTLKMEENNREHKEYALIRSEDLEKIEKYATEKLGMQYPDSYQVVSIHLPNENQYSHQMAALNEEDGDKKGIIKLIYGLLD